MIFKCHKCETEFDERYAVYLETPGNPQCPVCGGSVAGIRPDDLPEAEAKRSAYAQLYEVEAVREKLASYAHKQWSGWMEYLFSKCYTVYLEPTLQEPDGEAHLVIPKWAVDRWKKQIETSYEELSEPEKESDRKEADGMIEIFCRNFI